MKLKEIAHIRTGDKGNDCNICVIAYHENMYPYISRHLTDAVVADYFKEHCRGTVTRYDLPALSAFNFVLTEALGGGVTKSLGLDRHGKSYGMALGEIDI